MAIVATLGQFINFLKLAHNSWILYGDKKKPTVLDLQGIELMVFDIQDIGSRYYTYVSTLTHILESCSENNIPVLILDRPNPLGGDRINGPILDIQFRSFVGLHPIPIVHGMTILIKLETKS